MVSDSNCNSNCWLLKQNCDPKAIHVRGAECPLRRLLSSITSINKYFNVTESISNMCLPASGVASRVIAEDTEDVFERLKDRSEIAKFIAFAPLSNGRDPSSVTRVVNVSCQELYLHSIL